MKYAKITACIAAAAVTVSSVALSASAVELNKIDGATGFCCANDMIRKIREYYGSTPTKLRYGRE